MIFVYASVRRVMKTLRFDNRSTAKDRGDRPFGWPMELGSLPLVTWGAFLEQGSINDVEAILRWRFCFFCAGIGGAGRRHAAGAQGATGRGAAAAGDRLRRGLRR